MDEFAFWAILFQVWQQHLTKRVDYAILIKNHNHISQSQSKFHGDQINNVMSALYRLIKCRQYVFT